MKTSKDLDYNPTAIMAQNSGHTDPSFTEAVGKDVDGIASRSEFSLDLAAKAPA